MSKRPLSCMFLSLFLTSIALLSGCGTEKPPDLEVLTETESKPQASQEKLQEVSYIIQTNTTDLDDTYQISDTLYGIFFEDINFALDGGMYAQLIKNPSFEYGDVAGNQNKHGYILSNPDETEFRFTVADGAEDHSYLNKHNTHYGVLDNSGAEYCGIFNKGYLDGLYMESDAEYIFSGYFMSPSGYDKDVKISIKDQNGNIFAEGTIRNLTSDWKQYTLPLVLTKTPASQSETRLYIEIHTGTVYADMLSLMPTDTYKGTNIRKDIGEYLEHLSPSFLRFPGGCVIEGRDLESMYSWKDSIGNGTEWEVNGELTVGDIAVRPQGKSIWMGTSGHPYYTSYGIGFYEFFELCQILDCMPVPVLNAGMTCQVQSPKYIVFDLDSEEFAKCIQDALDLVEFCLGDQDTYWGSVRIAMGSEETFPLKYIGIGNEQWQNEYFQHYKRFVEAFENASQENPALYGDIELIIANGPSSGDRVGWNHLDRSPDNITTLVDEHYYESPNWFLTNTTRYDNYDREAQAKVFLGEYAAQSNTWEAALAEAAYMTGIERNSDVVALACYAPLFGNSVSNQWTPDLIWFSNDSVYGSVNYYVQKLFMNHVGTTILPSDLDIGDLTLDISLSGKVGLGTWQTSAAFDNLLVTSNDTGEILYSCNFDEDDESTGDFLSTEDIHRGSWSIEDGRLIQSNTGNPSDENTGDSIYIGDTSWSNYTMTVDAEILKGSEGFLIPICVENASNHIFWNLGGWGNSVSCLQIVSGNVKSGQISGTTKNTNLKQNQVYHLKVEVNDNNIKCYVNDMVYIDYTYESSKPLYETASIAENGDIIIKIVNASNQDINVLTTLEDIDMSLYHNTATLSLLEGETLSDMNTFDEPDKITPTEDNIEIQDTFAYTAPAYSVAVIRIVKK